MTRPSAFALLAAANLFWSGNWVIGRALRDAFDPVTLNFWRWLLAAAILAPFAGPALWRKRAIVRENALLVLLLGATGIATFHSLVYLGLRTTTTINAVLLNSSGPLFILLCAWMLHRERPSRRQVAGLAVSLCGILVIVSRGEPSALWPPQLHGGDGWVLLAMLAWGVYSVFAPRRPAGLGNLEFVLAVVIAGLLLLAPAYGIATLYAPPRLPTTLEALGVLYLAIGASVLAYICWNGGLMVTGAAAGGVTLHLLPAFGTVLAIVFLDERFAIFHAVGIAIILGGVALASSRSISIAAARETDR